MTVHEIRTPLLVLEESLQVLLKRVNSTSNQLNTRVLKTWRDSHLLWVRILLE